jgi:GT2 family glycosyltransferase
VVIDGDDDGSSSLAQELDMQVVRTGGHIGPTGARNQGAAIARGDILLFLDADVTVPADIIAKVSSLLKREPQLAAVIGSYDHDPAAQNFLSQYRNLLHHYVHQTSKEEAFTFWGACGAIRRSVFASLGGFDESYGRPSIEDIAFGYHLRRAGYRIRLEKSLQVKHLKHWAVWSMLRTDFLNRALPWSLLILREGRFPNDLNIRLSSRVSVAAAYVGLASLIIGGWWHPALCFSGVSAALFLSLNAPLYCWFRRTRGWSFTIMVLPWHLIYYLVSGLAFAAALTLHLAGAMRPEESKRWIRKHGLAGRHGESCD